jgi:anti-anti-sigma factor
MSAMTQQQTITTRHAGDVTIARIESSAAIDPQFIDDLRTALFRLSDDETCRNLVLDMSNLEHLSSSGLGVLIPLQQKFDQAGGALILVGLNGGLTKLLRVTKLDRLLKILPTEQDALAELGSSDG